MGYTIQIDLALPKIKVSNRAQLFERCARAIAKKLSYPHAMILDHLILNEQAVNSSIGDGVAIPQLKLKGIKKRFVTLVTLDRSIDFHSYDGKDVDIFCVLLSPESDGPVHLRGLSRISRILKDRDLCQKLRDTDDAETMRSLILSPEGWLMAA
jgi:PTS system nitrogen regulatory IIA component